MNNNGSFGNELTTGLLIGLGTVSLFVLTIWGVFAA
jgi:hypothetical protein